MSERHPGGPPDALAAGHISRHRRSLDATAATCRSVVTAALRGRRRPLGVAFRHPHLPRGISSRIADPPRLGSSDWLARPGCGALSVGLPAHEPSRSRLRRRGTLRFTPPIGGLGNSSTRRALDSCDPAGQARSLSPWCLAARRPPRPDLSSGQVATWFPSQILADGSEQFNPYLWCGPGGD